LVEKKPHAHELRKGRASLPLQVYLVTTVVEDRRPVFRDLYNGRILVRALRYQQEKGNANSLAYVIMPDHLHWLLQLGERRSLSQVVGIVKGFSARELNARLGGEGQFWQEGFHDHALRREEDLRAAARYVVANPLRAGLVRSVADYPLWDAVWV
jgi:REP element-mobilizing transposase RayT